MHSTIRGKFLIGLLFAVLTSLDAPGLAAAPTEPIRWEGWSDAAFDRARAEERLVILDLVAVWCHWCHVMEETTYRDPEVVRTIGAHFVALRVDQDSRPDLSNRYEDYGWPATIIFDASGKELVKFAGYIPPERMRTLLAGVVADPTPGPSVRAEAPRSSSGTALSEPQRRDLAALLAQRYDRDRGGWGFAKKFLDFDGVEWGLSRAGSPGGDADAERMARETLTLSRRLIDPVWGGLYQYSDSGDWDHPHFEKLLQFQAEGIRLYATAFARWRDPADLRAARDILRYVRAFLKSPEGAFYVSQDADLVPAEHSAEYYALDDAARHRKGIPRVDTHLYARENAWMVQALVPLYAVTDEPEILAEAVAAADWIVAQRALSGGGFRHDAADPAGPYLGDSVAAGRAFLALWSVTGDRTWLSRSRDAAAYVARTFAVDGDAANGVRKDASNGDQNPYVIQKELGKTMSDNCTIIRINKRMKQSLALIEDLKIRYRTRLGMPDGSTWSNQTLGFTRSVWDMLLLSEAIVKAAIAREESRGAHFKIPDDLETRTDIPLDDRALPRDDDHWLKSTLAAYSNGQCVLSYEPVDILHAKPVKRDYGKTGTGAGLTKTPAPTAAAAPETVPSESARQSPGWKRDSVSGA